MNALANAKAETFDLIEEIRSELDQAGLRSIYRGLIAQACAAYVFKHSLLSGNLEEIDVRTLDSDKNFKLAMTGEKLVIVCPTKDDISVELLRHYSHRSTDVPSRIVTLEKDISNLLMSQIDRHLIAYMFLHDLETVLRIRSNHLLEAVGA